MAIHLNKLPEFDLPKNALLDFSPIERMTQGWEKQRQFDESKAIERERMGIQKQHLDIAQGKADDERRQRQIEEWGRIASVIDETRDPAQRQAMWGKFVNSHPSFAGVFQKYGIDPGDHMNGPKFLRSQAGLYDPQKDREAQARIGLAGAQTNLYNSRAAYERDKAAAERETAEATKREMEDYALDPSGGLIIKQRRGARKAMLPGNPSAEPSMVEPTQARVSRDERNAQTARELAPIVQPNKPAQPVDDAGYAIPTEAQIQQYWSSVYGQKPPSGYKYTRTGVLEDMKGAKDNSRPAQKGALEAAHDNIQDARELLSQTNMATRTIGHYTGTGNMANAQRLVNLSIRGILHGISGAQINIPEQKEYFDSFKPGPFETEKTMLSKLGHLENTLAHIRRASGGKATDEQVLQIRNVMRQAMGLEPLSETEAGARFQDRQPRQAPQMMRPNTAPQPRGVPEGWGIKRVE